MKFTKRELESKNNNIEEVELKPFEVKLSDCGNDESRLIDRFMKKCKKHDIFRPILEKMYFKSNSQKRREKLQRAIRFQKKEQKSI